jgi:dipeptidyl aminopeptidase/acylaminoacyl peptidase
MSRPFRTVLPLLLVAAVPMAALPLAAQSPGPGGELPLVTPDDYGKFESLTTQVLAPRGDWLAYGIRRVDETEELRIVALAGGEDRTMPLGRSPVFSPDGRRLAWVVGAPPDAPRGQDDPVRPGAALLELATGAQNEWTAVRTFRFDAEGRFLALHGFAPDEPSGKGADLRVVELETGTVTSFGNVDHFAWSDEGSLLALAMATGTEEGNGVQLFDAAAQRLRSLDASGSTYRHLAWREAASDLAVLRSQDPGGADSTAHAVLAWMGLDQVDPRRVELDPHPHGVADTLQVVGIRSPEWADDGSALSFGLRPRAGPARNAGAEPDPDRETDPDGEPAGEAPPKDDDLELANVQLWHSSDVFIFPQQRSRATFDARRTLLAVWTPGAGAQPGRVVQVGRDLQETASLTPDWRRAVERSSAPYPWGTMFGRPYHDVWVTDVVTGESTQVLEEVRYSWTSPGGRFLLTFDGAHFHALELESGQVRILTEGLPTDFANVEYDTPTDLLPPHGMGGWIDGDEAVLLYDKHDIWWVAPDGSGARRVTGGAEDEVTHRLLRVGGEPAPGVFDQRGHLYLSLRDERSEGRGFARLHLAGNAGQLDTLLLDDVWPRSLVRADSAEVYLYRSEARHISPELWVGGPDLADARRVAGTNPFLDEMAWTWSELIHFESEAGIPLKGVLLYPANHDPDRAYPMIVYTYELLSSGIHSFQVPSERSYYNFSVWTQAGYFVLLPDIVYRARDPGVSALEAVRPAVASVVERGLVDPARVGLIGHSWGGYQATYLPTRTDIFAASVAGAPLTDFKSFMGQIHWGGGNPEVSHWETGQGRMEVPYWEDVEAHLRNSPAHFAHEMDTPLLMAFGDDDGVVEWWQGTLFYNFARRAGKDMVLVVYEGEGHGFSREPNQIDYHRRILEWFGHYLKGEPAPGWITDGVPYGELEQERRRIRTGTGGGG